MRIPIKLKYICYAAASICMIFFINACIWKQEKSGDFSTAENTQQEETVKINMTVTSGSDEENFISRVLQINTEDESVKTIAEVPYTSQYPLTCYSEGNGNIYYVACSEDKHGDEVFQYDHSSGETKQLTNDFYAINYLFYTKKGLFIAAVLRGDHTAVQPFFYSFEDEELESLSWDDDFYIRCAGKNIDTSSIYIGGHSEKEKDEVFDGDIIGIDNYIYQYDVQGMKKTEILKKEKCYINDVAADKNMLVYTAVDKIFNSKATIYIRNMETGEEKEIEVNGGKAINFIVGLSDREMYYTVKGYKGADSRSGLYRMNLDTEESTLIYMTDFKECINNAQMVLQ